MTCAKSERLPSLPLNDTELLLNLPSSSTVKLVHQFTWLTLQFRKHENSLLKHLPLGSNVLT